ncbi:MAG: N-acyl amino acid synthase FeeM domain-containing protein, partial [Pirellulales bacterium]
MATFQLQQGELDSPETGAPTVFKVAANQAERAAAFRLVYQSYVRAGLVEENPCQMRVTPYHLLDSTQVFIAVCQNEVISTVSLVGDGVLGLPMEGIYAEEVEQLRWRGIALAEVSSLADRRRQLSRTLPVFVSLMRLMVQSARHRGIERLLVAVHPRHARFYQRVLSFENVGDLKSYPLVRNNPAVALSLDFAKLDRVRPVNYDTFFGELLPEQQLVGQPMDDDERHCFAPAAK